MKLEQSLYDAKHLAKEDLKVYQIGDLESLSANVLYSGDLYIKDFNDGSSLHIHEVMAK